jgi:hypothetical protein
MKMSDIKVEKQISNDDSALSSSCTSSPSSQTSSIINNNDTSDISFSSSFENSNKASEFEAELSHIHNKMIVIFLTLNFTYSFKIFFFFRNLNTA